MLHVEERKIELVYPYPNNPRKNRDSVAAVAASIKEFGWQQPIVVDTGGVIICGHTRYEAAKLLGLASVPVHVARDLSPEQIKAYRIADNKTAELASWDNKLLAEELVSLVGKGFDLSLLSFSNDELQRLLPAMPGVVGASNPDEVPQLPEDPRTQVGDLWLLGPHRLLCGDSAKWPDVERLLGGDLCSLAHTDPPYNVAVESRSQRAMAAGTSSFPGKGKAAKLRAKDRSLANDQMSDEAFAAMLQAWFGNLSKALDPGASFYCWGGYANVASYPRALAGAGLYFSQAIIWVKEHPVMGRKDFMGNHEWCFYGWKEGAGHRWLGPRNVPDVWQFSRSGPFIRGGGKVYPLGDGLSVNSTSGVGLDIVPSDAQVSRRSLMLEDDAVLQVQPGVGDVWFVKKMHSSQTVHLTEKPTELASRAIRYSSRPGERVLDLFGGSGSTLIACEQLGRVARLMELDRAYCDVIVQRFVDFSGKEAHCVKSDGSQETWRKS